MLVREESNKAFWDVRVKICKEMYEKLDTKEAEKHIYRNTLINERNSRYLHTVKYVKNEDKMDLIQRDQEKWKRLFWQLYNGIFIHDLGDFTIQFQDISHSFMLIIRESGSKKVLKRMK